MILKNYHSKEIKNIFLQYGSTTLFTLLPAFIGIFMAKNFAIIHPLIFLPLSTTLITWKNGFKQGIYSLFVYFSLYLLYTYFSLFPTGLAAIFLPGNILAIVVLISQSAVISYLVDKARQTNEVNIYKSLLNEVNKKLNEVQTGFLKAQNEIKARDEFLSIASHELKTPLTSMLLHIQRAVHNIKNVSLANFSVANLLKMLESVEQQTKRLAKMISDLLNVSLITTGKFDLQPEKMDLVLLVKDIAEKLPLALRQEDYPLTVSAAEKIVGNWDKVRIEQAISNLITNAIKYGDDKPVEIKLEKTDHTAKIIVKDQGIGIPKNQQERIFARFERSVPNGKYQGLGVGLYITKQIVNAHQGIIRLDSKESYGSTFIIELPL